MKNVMPTIAGRLLSTVLLWGGLIALFLFGGNSGVIALWLAVGILTCLETNRLLHPKKQQGIFGQAALILYLLLLAATAWKTGRAPHPLADLFAFSLVLPLSFFSQFKKGITDQVRLDTVLKDLFCFVYCCLLFSFILRIYLLPENHQQGLYYVLFLILVTKFTDMGAYLTGSLIGKHPMAPHISPKKTWQGFFGGLGFALLGAFALIQLLPEQLKPLTLPYALGAALIMGLLAVAGDLAESVLKRAADSKDSGTFLPGIGGTLDLVDSLLFTAPFLYFLLHLLR